MASKEHRSHAHLEWQTCETNGLDLRSEPPPPACPSTCFVIPIPTNLLPTDRATDQCATLPPSATSAPTLSATILAATGTSSSQTGPARTGRRARSSTLRPSIWVGCARRVMMMLSRRVDPFVCCRWWRKVALVRARKVRAGGSAGEVVLGRGGGGGCE